MMIIGTLICLPVLFEANCFIFDYTVAQNENYILPGIGRKLKKTTISLTNIKNCLSGIRQLKLNPI